MYALKKGDETIATSEAPISWDERGPGWLVGDTIFADPEQSCAVTQFATTLSPVQFKLCFTAPERVAAKALINAEEPDALLADFWSILDDPRLTEVDLGLASTQAGIDYLVSLGVITAERAVQVKAGVVL